MLAMQYEISLPTDYDMTRIRDRVAMRGHALDHYPGLGLKAYLIRDVATGAAVNAYAPLYLWTDDAAAGRFLWGGDGFGGIVRDFGRPTVHTWLGGDHRTGKAGGTPPRHAVKMTRQLAPDLDPQAAAGDAATLSNALLEADDLHSLTWAIDPTSWELLVFTLHTRPRHASPQHTSSRHTGPALKVPPGWGHASSVTYEVLHLSTPIARNVRREPFPSQGWSR